MEYTIQNENATKQEWESLFSDTFRGVLKNVYLWMSLGLFITAFVSIALVYTPLISLLVMLFEVPFLFTGLLIGEVVLVIWLSRRIGVISVGASRLGFIAYAILNGITMTAIFLVYTGSSIAMTFIATSAIFGAMSIIGYTTKIDLSKWGSYLLMGLIGFLIGSVANMFFAVSALDWILTYVGIALFIALTVYDTQQIKKMIAVAMLTNDETMVKRTGLLGALRLYLDFINLFLLILRLFGRRK